MRRSVHLPKQRSIALSSLQWTQMIPKTRHDDSVTVTPRMSAAVSGRRQLRRPDLRCSCSPDPGSPEVRQTSGPRGDDRPAPQITPCSRHKGQLAMGSS
jgi:hypothetical protein